MAKPKDQDALDCYTKVLLDLGHCRDYIRWQPQALKWLSVELENVGVQLVHVAMQEYVKAGGKIDQVEERRPEYFSWRFHYDLRLPISGRRVYVETVLDQAKEIEDCTIWVVNIHDK
jgi:hypothetical protein